MQGLAEPSIEQAQSLASAGDWSAAIDTYSEYLRGLSAEQYRDKKDFAWILDEYERVRRPRGEAGYREFSEIIQRKLEDRAPGDPDRWRLYRALAGIDEKLRDPRSQREHLQQAIDEYPPDIEGNPAQHSSIQHLYNSVAMLVAATSIEEAEKYLLDSYEQDPRFVCVFLPPWQQLYKERNEAARYDRLIEQVLGAYERKADREPSLRVLLEEYTRQTRALKR
jgi:tetratricopeptide (TPR) repeat protein